VCMVCIDLIKQSMTIIEAERNVGELLWTTKDNTEFRHYMKLSRSIKNFDLKELDEALEEGINGNQ